MDLVSRFHVHVHQFQSNGPGVEETSNLLGISLVAQSLRSIVTLRAPIANSDGFHRKMDDDTGNKITQLLYTRWCQQCRAEHLGCRLLHERLFYPTRLPEMEEQSQNFTVRLVESWDAKSSGGYDIESMLVFIEVHQAPARGRSFHGVSYTLRRLAAHLPACWLVSLRLGCRYLWMDSLRISQDSPDHWMYESSK